MWAKLTRFSFLVMWSITTFFMTSFSLKYLSMYSFTFCSENPVISTHRSKQILSFMSSDSSDLEVIMTTESFKIFPLISLAHRAATGISSWAPFGYCSSRSLVIKLCFEHSSYPSMMIKTSSEWWKMYSNKESSIFESSSNTEDRIKISFKLTGSSPSKFNWRNVNKKANLKSGSCAGFVWDWNNLLPAQSRINFWQNSVLPIPAFPVTRTVLGFFLSWQSASEMKMSWQCVTGFPLTWPYCWRCFPLPISGSSTGFLPCCIRRLVYVSSILTLVEVGEATLWNSVWVFIDFFNAFVYASTAEKETQMF